MMYIWYVGSRVRHNDLGTESWRRVGVQERYFTLTYGSSVSSYHII